MINHIKANFEKIKLPSSGFYLDKILFLDAEFNKLRLIKGKSYKPLPKLIANKKAIINPKNENHDCCFAWAVIAALNYEDIGNNRERISKLKRYIANYDWSGLEFPVAIKDIKTFEKK